MARQRLVWLFGAPAGILSQIDGRLSFSYSSDWLNTNNTITLSQSLPLQAEAFADRAAKTITTFEAEGFGHTILPQIITVRNHAMLHKNATGFPH